MANPTLFLAGSIVQLIEVPEQTGTIISAEPKIRGSKIRQQVRWTNGQVEYVNIATLAAVQDTPKSDEDLIIERQFGKCVNFKDSLIHHRLSGSLEDMVYSLNLTNTEFYSYQFKPLLTFFDSFNKSLLIADEVGLGKTIEAGLIWTELTIREGTQRLVVVCPAALCEKWQNELLSKFDIKAQIVDANELHKAIIEITTGQIRSGYYIISYEGLRPPKGWKDWTPQETDRNARARLASYLNSAEPRGDTFQMLIVDEAHRLRNEHSQQHKAVAALREFAENVLFLSATPIQTGNDNLFALLNILDPSTYPYPETLDAVIRMNEPLIELESLIAQSTISTEELKHRLQIIKDKRLQYGFDVSEIDFLLNEDVSNHKLKDKVFRVDLIKRINRLNPLNRMMTRTLKRDVQERRVVRNPKTLTIELSEGERQYYDEVTASVRRFCESRELPVGFILTFSQQMMSSCLPASLQYWARLTRCDNDTFKELSDEFFDESDNGEDVELGPMLRELNHVAKKYINTLGMLQEDTKFNCLLETIKKQLTAEGSKKVIVFSFYKTTLRYLEAKLRQHRIRVARVDGSIHRSDRYKIVEDFSNDQYDVMLCSEAMAEGIDLQFVDCLVNYDLPWNPARIEQRIGRIDRIGQKSPSIKIFNFIYKSTIEEQIHQRLLERLAVFTSALGLAEDVLGAQIDTLTKNLFSKTLTKAEEIAEIERAAIAIENCRKQTEEAKGNSIIFDLMNGQIDDIQRLQRYVTGEDLLEYVKGFCRLDEGNSRLYLESKDLYKLEFSSKARIQLEAYLTANSKILEPTNILSNPKLKLKFVNKKGQESLEIERVTQTHPLIKFITHWIQTQQKSENKNKTCAISLQKSRTGSKTLDEIPDGTYFFRCQLWSILFDGFGRRKAKIGYVAINPETGDELTDEQAEFLVSNAVRFGQDLKNYRNLPDDEMTQDAVEDTEDLLAEKRNEYVASVRQAAEQEALTKKNTNTQKLVYSKQVFAEQMQKFDDEEKRGVPGVQGRRQAVKLRFEKKFKELENNIARAEQSMTIRKVEPTTIALGFIELSKED